MGLGGEKNPIFRQYLAISWKWCQIGPWLLWNVIMKSMLVPMTLSDLEMRDARNCFPGSSRSPYNVCSYRLTDSNQIRHGNLCWEGLFVRNGPSQRAGRQRTPIL